VRKAEYARLRGKDGRFIKGQKYTLLSRHDNLTLDGKRSLALLLAANKRLNTAYLLKEAFGQIWDYRREGWARRFFNNWRASLKWQRLKPYERFADMIDRHWDGIAAYCEPQNKVSLGFVEGLNNKIRVFQRRAYGLKDAEYLRLKVLSCIAFGAMTPVNHLHNSRKTLKMVACLGNQRSNHAARAAVHTIRSRSPCRVSVSDAGTHGRAGALAAQRMRRGWHPQGCVRRP
jgi:hypothetical protein